MPDYKDLTPVQIIKLLETQDIETLEMTKIRADLESGGVEEEDIQIVLRIIGNNKMKNANRQLESKQGAAFLRMGLIVMAVGILITVVTYSVANVQGGVYVLAWGPVLSGFLLAAIGAGKKYS